MLFLPILIALVVDTPEAPAEMSTPAPTTSAPTTAPTTATTTTEPTPLPPSPPADRQRVLVLDLKGVGVDDDTTRTVNGVVASIVSESQSLDVATSADLRTIVDVSVAKQSVGCDASSCLGDLAGAFGARYILYGDLGRLDENVIVNLSLFDATAAAAVSRTSVTVRRISEMRTTLRPKMAELLAPVGGLPKEEKTTSPLFYAGVVGAGLGVATAVIGGTVAGVAEATAGNPDAAIKDKEQALDNGSAGLVVAGVGVGVALAGAAVTVVTLVLEAE